MLKKSISYTKQSCHYKKYLFEFADNWYQSIIFIARILYTLRSRYIV